MFLLGETVRKYEISFLPPLLLTFELPENYPSSSPPSFTLTCSWLTHMQVITESNYNVIGDIYNLQASDCSSSTGITSVYLLFPSQLSALAAHLSDLYQATGGTVVLFSWVQFLKEDALRVLDIHTLLELSSEKHTPQYNSLEAQNAEPKNNAHSKSFTTSAQVYDAKEDKQADFDESECHQFAPSQKIVQEAILNEDDVSEGEGASSLPVHPRDPPNNDQTLSPSRVLLSQILIYNADQKHKVFTNTVFDCGVCFMGLLGSDCVQLPECGHIFCQACLAEFCKVQIREGNVLGVTCPQADCTATPTPAQVKLVF